jgi:hypothetical protein
MRAVQITRFGGPEVMDIVDLPDPQVPVSSSTKSARQESTSPTPTTDGVLGTLHESCGLLARRGTG